MGLHKIKLLAGTTMSLLLSVVAVYPAAAQPTGQGAGNGSTMQMNSSQTMRGTVRSVSGNTVTVETANGQTGDITVSTAEIQRLNLRPGVEIVATRMNDGSVTLALAQGMNGTTTSTDTTVNTTNQAGMRGTIRSIVGEVVTIQMPNGESRAVTVSEEQITNLKLRPGMTIVATPMSNSDNANVRVELANDTTVDTTGSNMASMTGTVRSVAGDVVTVEMPDGTTQTITLTRSDSNRLNLTPGSQVMVMMNNGVATLNMATNTGLTTDTTGSSGSTTTLERRTTISTDTPAPNTVDRQPATATTRRTTVRQQRTSTRRTTTRPAAARRAVRALW